VVGSAQSAPSGIIAFNPAGSWSCCNNKSFGVGIACASGSNTNSAARVTVKVQPSATCDLAIFAFSGTLCSKKSKTGCSARRACSSWAASSSEAGIRETGSGSSGFRDAVTSGSRDFR